MTVPQGPEQPIGFDRWEPNGTPPYSSHRLEQAGGRVLWAATAAAAGAVIGGAYNYFRGEPVTEGAGLGAKILGGVVLAGGAALQIQEELVSRSSMQ